MSTVAPAAAPPARSPLPPAVPPLPVYRLSVAQYEAMTRQGILAPEDRVELIEGWLVPKMSKDTPHSIATGLVDDALTAHRPADWHVRIQEPVTLAHSVPEPDAAVVRGARRAYLSGHPAPGDVGLVVEVADSSLDYDRTIKRQTYAQAGIATYWIVNLIDHLVEVHTDPTSAVAPPDYASMQTYGPGDEVPLILNGTEVARISVADLLP